MRKLPSACIVHVLLGDLEDARLADTYVDCLRRTDEQTYNTNGPSQNHPPRQVGDYLKFPWKNVLWILLQVLIFPYSRFLGFVFVFQKSAYA